MRRWRTVLRARGMHLPSRTQVFRPASPTRVDMSSVTTARTPQNASFVSAYSPFVRRHFVDQRPGHGALFARAERARLRIRVFEFLEAILLRPDNTPFRGRAFVSSRSSSFKNASRCSHPRARTSTFAALQLKLAFCVNHRGDMARLIAEIANCSTAPARREWASRSRAPRRNGLVIHLLAALFSRRAALRSVAPQTIAS